MQPLVTPGSQGEAIGRLVLAGLVVVVLPALPFGVYLIYPFSILTTWFHEMGHGLTALALVAALLALVAWRASSGFARFTLQFLGVLGAMSMLRDWGYLFTENAVIEGRAMLSDTGQIAAVLGLPHWFWAGVILLTSAVMVGGALKYALAENRLRPPPRKRPANVLQFRRD